MRNRTLKICAMLLAICTSTIHMQAMDEWDGVTQAKGFYSGTGTKTDPYRIFTASQFLYFIQQTKDGNTFSGQYVELCNDIAFKTNEGLVKGADFYGDFDGNDHTIKVYEWTAESPFWAAYIAIGWHLFNLYGSMHDVYFVNANEVMTICTDGILYNCGFDFGNNSFKRGGYHGNATVFLKGGTIANCVSNDAYYHQGLEQGKSQGFVHEYVDTRRSEKAYGNCLNCYFPIKSYWYGGELQGNYYGSNIESCGEDAGNDWVLNHTEYDYKSWPLTFSPIYPEFLIQEQPQTYNPLVVYPHSDEALYQWCYQERKPIIFEDFTYSTSTQTKNIVVPGNDGVLSFDFKADGYTYTGYNDGTDIPAWISINGEKIVNVYEEIDGSYSCPVHAGTYEISCARTEISNIRFAYPTDTIENETSSVLSKQTIMDKPGAYFCQVSYGEGCDVMYSDYVDYERLLTIDNVTYVINEDSTATVLWVADMAVDITILKRVKYNDVNYPVTSISSKAFVDCTSLESIKCIMLDAPTLLGGTTFEELTGVLIPSNVTLYVSASSKNTYANAIGWSSFQNILEFSAPKYTVTYMVEGEVYYTEVIEQGTEIPMIDTPTKEGHTFTGWSNLPSNMPDEDVTVSAMFTPNNYIVTFKANNEIVSSESLAYGTPIVVPEAPKKEGYTFNGWGEVAETVPAGDVTYEGTYSVNSYKLTFTVDDEVVQELSINYGDTITLSENPTKEGYTFSGWSGLPETMPASDVTVMGSFSINTYIVTFMIDGVKVATYSWEYGSKIVVPDVPEREGYTFSGWGEVPETVPAEDIIFYGGYTANVYKVYYFVGAKLVHIAEVAYGETIPEYIYEPMGEGEVFVGWIGDAYETMPAHDVTYTANLANGIEYSTQDAQYSIIYDIFGRRITDIENMKGGIYIINGKKVLVK